MELFKKAFPKDKEPITAENIAKAIGAFERTLVTPSRFDDFLKGNTKALTPEEKRGLNTFIEVGCVACHNGALVGGTMYQKFGVYEPYWKYTKSKSVDEGRYEVTKKEEDKYVFNQVRDIVAFLKSLTGKMPDFTLVYAFVNGRHNYTVYVLQKAKDSRGQRSQRRKVLYGKSYRQA